MHDVLMAALTAFMATTAMTLILIVVLLRNPEPARGEFLPYAPWFPAEQPSAEDELEYQQMLADEEWFAETRRQIAEWPETTVDEGWAGA